MSMLASASGSHGNTGHGHWLWEHLKVSRKTIHCVKIIQKSKRNAFAYVPKLNLLGITRPRDRGQA